MPTPSGGHPELTDGHVNCDLTCAHCGYNLRTLADDANCPECNQPVKSTIIERAALRAVSPWVQRRRIALTAVFVLILLTMDVIIGTDLAVRGLPTAPSPALANTAAAILAPTFWGLVVIVPGGRSIYAGTWPLRVRRWLIVALLAHIALVVGLLYLM